MSSETQTCRPLAEIERMHNLLWNILIGPGTEAFRTQDLILMATCLNTLCWVLRHEKNPVFEENLKRTVERLRRDGIEVSTESPSVHPDFRDPFMQLLRHLVN